MKKENKYHIKNENYKVKDDEKDMVYSIKKDMMVGRDRKYLERI